MMQRHYPAKLLTLLEDARLEALEVMDEQKQSSWSQYFTPTAVACMMASMVEANQEEISILDAGAGIGTLFTACVVELCRRQQKPKLIRVVCYEVDGTFTPYLERSLVLCRDACKESGIEFISLQMQRDFIEDAVNRLIIDEDKPFSDFEINCAVVNPPYQKINSKTNTRKILKSVEIDASNLYSAFIALCARLIRPGGEMVAITPRSFCNGPHHRNFRIGFVKSMRFARLHLFESRKKVFSGANILQETMIFHAVKDRECSKKVSISSSFDPVSPIDYCSVEYDKVVWPGDPESFIRFTSNKVPRHFFDKLGALTSSLADLGLHVLLDLSWTSVTRIICTRVI